MVTSVSSAWHRLILGPAAPLERSDRAAPANDVNRIVTHRRLPQTKRVTIGERTGVFKGSEPVLQGGCERARHLKLEFVVYYGQGIQIDLDPVEVGQVQQARMVEQIGGAQ